MFAQVLAARDSLAVSVRELDVASLTGIEATRLLKLLGEVRRLTDTLFIAVSGRVNETNAHHGSSDRNAAAFCARHGGVERGDAARALATAKKTAAHPDVANALNTGSLTARQASIITNAADVNPAAASRLVAAAQNGPQALNDACLAARAEVESHTECRARQRNARMLSMWTNDEGMVEGRFRLTPEIGGQVKAIVELGAQRRFRRQRGNESIGAMAADTLVALILAAARAGRAPKVASTPVEHNASANGHSSQSESESDVASGQDATLFDDTLFDDIVSASAAPSTQAAPPSQSTRSTQASAADRPRTSDCGPTGPTVNDGRQPISDAHDNRNSGDPDDDDSDYQYFDDIDVDAVLGVKPTVHIVIDHDALTRGHAVDGEQCEIPGVGPVNVEWVRALLGDAFVTAVIKHGTDIAMVAHFGRHINAELRTALIVGGRECVVDGCHCRGYLEIDHQHVDHAKHGPTALWNLGWLCLQHHRLKSSGWTLGPPDPKTAKRCLQPPLARSA
jgi:hypothetical protein